MPRPKKIDRPKRLEINLPSSLFTHMTIDLYSDLENRVPYGAYSTLIEGLLREYLESKGHSL